MRKILAKSSWKTTLGGLVGGLLALIELAELLGAGSIAGLTDGQFSSEILILGAGLLVTGFFGRDNNKTSEAVKANIK